MKNGMRWVLIAIVVAAVMIGGATVAIAAEGECPQQVGNGVICAGPSIPANTQPDGSELSFQLGEPLNAADVTEGDDAACPIPVGDGVICTGPTLPGEQPVDGQSITFDNWVYLPVVRS